MTLVYSATVPERVSERGLSVFFRMYTKRVWRNKKIPPLK